jgi:sugar lactone lactonase YvrE
LNPAFARLGFEEFVMKLKSFFGFVLLVAALGAVNCGGGGGGGTGGGGGGGLPGSFPAGIYVMQNTIQDITSMSNMTGANWLRYLGKGAGLGMTFDSQGRLYVVNHALNRITRYNSPTDTGTVFGTGGNGVGQFSNPTSVAIDAQGKIYIADGGNRRLVKIDDMQGNGWTTMSMQPYFSSLVPQMDIDFDSMGRLLIVSRIDRKVVQVDNLAGANPHLWGGAGNGVAQFDVPSDICVDNQDRIYICDTGNNRIVRMTTDGFNWASFGSLGDGVGQFNKPVGVTVDSQGRIYTFDVNNARIVRIDDMTGAGWTTYGGSGTSGVGEFSEGSDIFIK